MEMLAPYSQNGLRFTMIAIRTTGDPMEIIGRPSVKQWRKKTKTCQSPT